MGAKPAVRLKHHEVKFVEKLGVNWQVLEGKGRIFESDPIR
jgi:hypothetical protein